MRFVSAGREIRRFLWKGSLGRVWVLGLVLAVAACRASSAPATTTPANPAAVSPTTPGATSTGLVRVVAAENFYGDLATQIGGDRVHVVAILSDPNADPHEYESNAADAKAIANAQIVIKNGLGYDAFIDHLMSASPRPNRVVLDAGEITGHRQGDNPHVWYDPKTMPEVARRLADALAQIDPAHRDYFAARLQAFDSKEKAVDDKISAMRSKYQGTRVLMTEPVFDYMATALGLAIVDQQGAFQRAVEEGNDPAAAAVAQFRNELASHVVRVLIYNDQTVTPITTQMQDVAKQNGVPVVPVSETEPAGKTYQEWMLSELSTLQQALGR